jgi:probable HAF family extracellular repeat protein
MKVLIELLAATVAALLASSVYGANLLLHKHTAQTLYLVVSLGNPLGGDGQPYGIGNLGNSINNKGWVAGEADLTGNATMHAELWGDGTPIDLGTLGGANSAVAWPNHNDHGVIVGIAETADVNVLGEDWSCGLAVFPTVTHHICLGFVWKDGQMTALPTLGGYDGFATGVNNRDQIVGWAENGINDPTCDANNQVQQFEAVLWTRINGQYQAAELPPYPGDLDGAATSINRKGYVVGISGTCGGAIGGATAQHMVMWHRGVVIRSLPTLGGAYWNTPMDINNHGNVIGFSDLPGDSVSNPNFNAFFWSDKPYLCSGEKITGTCNLGTLSGDSLSESLGINDQDQVVGVSYPSGHAFIWQDGVMTDLNTLIAPGSPSVILTDAQDINDHGVITGQAYDPSTGIFSAFIAYPTN